MADLTGLQLENYRLERLLGRGGASVVYLARHVETRQRYAVKVLLSQLAADPEIARRFREGGHLAASLHHPNIIHVYRVGEDKGYSFIVTEYLAGGTLEQRLKGKPWQMTQVLVVLRQIAAALDHAHERGIVHLDVKPSNILFSADGKRVVLCDFGISQSLLRPERANKPSRSGTVAYMSPEQCRGQAVGQATDVYSLAVVAYQMLTGRLPFYAEEPLAMIYQQINQSPPPPRRINRGISQAGEQALLRGLAKDPAKRYHKSDDFVRALVGKRPPITPEPHKHSVPVKQTEPAKPRVNSRWPIAIIGALLLSVPLGWWLLRGLGGGVTPSPIVITKVAYVTATDSPSSAIVAPEPTSTQRPTSTRSPSTMSSPSVTPALSGSPATVRATSALPMAICPDQEIARITSPRQGQEITGAITVVGTAGGPRFVRYELFYRRSDERQLHQYLGKAWYTQVTNGPLATWNPHDPQLRLPPGSYDLDLRVVDSTGNYKECAVLVVVK